MRGDGRQGLRAGRQRRRRCPGIVQASYAMPDAHWGYGFPIGGRRGVRPRRGRRRVGGRRRLRHLLRRALACTPASRARTSEPARNASSPTRCSAAIPAGVGSTGAIRLAGDEMDAHAARRRALGGRARLRRAARPRAHRGARADGGARAGQRLRARQEAPARRDGDARLRQPLPRGAARREVFDRQPAAAFGLRAGDVVVSIHCGSRGLGHQIGTEFLREMALEATAARDRRCPTASSPARRSARRRAAPTSAPCAAAINCALANRQILTHLAREAFAAVAPAGAAGPALRRLAQHLQGRRRTSVDGKTRKLYVHRKGATRAFGPGHPGPARRRCATSVSRC